MCRYRPLQLRRQDPFVLTSNTTTYVNFTPCHVRTTSNHGILCSRPMGREAGYLSDAGSVGHKSRAASDEGHGGCQFFPPFSDGRPMTAPRQTNRGLGVCVYCWGVGASRRVGGGGWAQGSGGRLRRVTGCLPDSLAAGPGTAASLPLPRPSEAQTASAGGLGRTWGPPADSIHLWGNRSVDLMQNWKISGGGVVASGTCPFEICPARIETSEPLP